MLLAALLRNKSGGKNTLEHVSAQLFHTSFGQVLVSALFGLALAFMFQRVCKDRKCIIIEAPPLDEIRGSTYKLDNKCFQYTPKPAPCDDDEPASTAASTAASKKK